jgi:hypothetical protein
MAIIVLGDADGHQAHQDPQEPSCVTVRLFVSGRVQGSASDSSFCDGLKTWDSPVMRPIWQMGGSRSWPEAPIAKSKLRAGGTCRTSARQGGTSGKSRDFG